MDGHDESTFDLIQDADTSIAYICDVMLLLQSGCGEMENGDQFAHAMAHFKESLEDVRMKLDCAMSAFTNPPRA